MGQTQISLERHSLPEVAIPQRKTVPKTQRHYLANHQRFLRRQVVVAEVAEVVVAAVVVVAVVVAVVAVEVDPTSGGVARQTDGDWLAYLRSP